MRDAYGKMTISYKYKDVNVKMSADPFAEGSQRLSYFGIEIGRRTHMFSALFGSGVENRATVVLKTFKHVYERVSGDGRDDFLNLVETQAIANHFAEQFNKVKPREARPG